jgi:hypothetical protein
MLGSTDVIAKVLLPSGLAPLAERKFKLRLDGRIAIMESFRKAPASVAVTWDWGQ